MALYGILKTTTNTGIDGELLAVFSTPLSIFSNRPVYAADSLNLKRKRSRMPAQRWEMEANMAMTNNSSALLVHSVVNGNTESIYIRMPQVYGVSRPPTANIISVNADVVKGNTYVPLTGVSTSRLAPGEFINFQNHSKVYMVISCNAVGMDVEPALVSDVPSTTRVIHGDAVTLKALYDDSKVMGITYKDGVLSDPGSLKFVEDL